jgi:hypothetical protein
VVALFADHDAGRAGGVFLAAAGGADRSSVAAGRIQTRSPFLTKGGRKRREGKT